MTDLEAIQLLIKMKELGITELEVGAMKQRMANHTKAVADEKAEDIVAPLSGFEELDEDEVLYWSTPYYDELQALKEKQAQHKKEQIES